MKTPQSISLVGIMGSGKTCIAKKIAKKLGVYHIDTDKEIKLISGLSVKELIDQNKEDLLKQTELAVIEKHIHNKCVISTGDYTVNNDTAWKLVIENSVSVWINSHLSQVIIRLKPSENRPFFTNTTELTKLKQLYHERKSRYQQSKIELRGLNAAKIEQLLKIIKYFNSETIVL